MLTQSNGVAVAAIATWVVAFAVAVLIHSLCFPLKLIMIVIVIINSKK